LKPLKWCHLLVPLVPSALAKDLVQYPAPFILGMNSEEPAVMSIMNDLPIDVTLVDLDVGRVILAPDISFDRSDMGNSGSIQNTNSALRSQVLYLAQILGSHFGANLFRVAWSCDSPSLSLCESSQLPRKEAHYDILRSVCRSFIDELLAGKALMLIFDGVLCFVPSRFACALLQVFVPVVFGSRKSLFRTS
jgi:DENN (AEX-3) domain